MPLGGYRGSSYGQPSRNVTSPAQDLTNVLQQQQSRPSTSGIKQTLIKRNSGPQEPDNVKRLITQVERNRRPFNPNSSRTESLSISSTSLKSSPAATRSKQLLNAPACKSSFRNVRDICKDVAHVNYLRKEYQKNNLVIEFTAKQAPVWKPTLAATGAKEISFEDLRRSVDQGQVRIVKDPLGPSNTSVLWAIANTDYGKIAPLTVRINRHADDSSPSRPTAMRSKPHHHDGR